MQENTAGVLPAVRRHYQELSSHFALWFCLSLFPYVSSWLVNVDPTLELRGDVELLWQDDRTTTKERESSK